MIEQQIRDLFAETADREPPASSQVDLHRARRQGRARLRWRRASLAGASALAAAAVAALFVVVVPSGRGHSPAPAGPAAPRQFNPLVTNLSFGWLPAGLTIGQGLTEPTVVLQGLGAGIPSWTAEAYARGQCHLTGSAGGLKCAGRNGSSLRFDAPAPDVNGHRAFWAGANLAWEYARGGWAYLNIPVQDYATLKNKPALEHQALRMAANLRIGGSSAPLAFPAKFTGLTGHWRIAELNYFAEDGVLQTQEFTLISDASRFLPHVGDLGVWTNAAYVIGNPATSSGTCSPDDPATQNTREIINGYHMVLKLGHAAKNIPRQELCGAHAGGLWFDIEEFGSRPPIGVTKLFRDHVHLLGRNPADWTQNPVG
jgi:hypothetical protein